MQCCLNNLPLNKFSLSNLSINGEAYCEIDAVKIKISNNSEISFKKLST